MLESVLANVLTQILGQYLHGIDRNSVSFGAWSGLVELRGVALRAEALSVLFETLGMDLPVTVEAGFIGLLRVVVPWKSIGSTPVKIELEGVNIIARPVRDDGSDDSEIKIRERRIKRAKLNTDDAVREASWSVSNSDASKKGKNWSWLVSDDLLAKVVANIQIELRDLILRFEDPFSNSEKPYAVSIHCETLKAVSANESWEQVFVENVSSPRTHKLVIVEGFNVDWLPLKTADVRKYSNPGTSIGENVASDYATHEKLQNFFSEEEVNSTKASSSEHTSKKPSNLISPISGSLRLSLVRAQEQAPENFEESPLPADAQVDIRFPDISLQLDDVQYASLVQTSLHFSKLSIRGYTPKTPKERWVWAVEQLLPGFRDRRARLLSFTEDGILAKRNERYLYTAGRMSLLKARRNDLAQPGDVAKDMEAIEDGMPFDRVVIYRDLVDEEFEKHAATWALASGSSAPAQSSGTTMSSFWSMLGYETEQNESKTENPPSVQDVESRRPTEHVQGIKSRPIADINEAFRKKRTHTPTAQVSFHLRRGSICLSEGGFPGPRTPRVDLIMRDLIIGAKRFQSNGFLIEVLLGTVEAWDVKNDVRMVYTRVPRSISGRVSEHVSNADSSYPVGVADALRAIRTDFESTNLPISTDEHEVLSSEEFLEPDPAISADVPEEVDAFDGVYKPTDVSRQNNDLATWATQATDSSVHATHRVTDAEFFGKGREEQILCLPYIAAFQIYRKPSEQLLESKKRNQTHIVAAVGQLEAVVDGPKGSFLWAARFWNPKGLRQDPIMAFLGAAAGARIAELRMELEEALLADRLPLQVDAFVRAPRFIIPGKTSSSPAIVVNMGTLGIRTSENEARAEGPSLKSKKPVGNYSNYALSLDDLGMYIAPSEKLATSLTRSLPREGPADSALIDEFVDLTTDVKSIERLIRPLSMRFFVQVLRDASTVQVVTGLSQREQDASSRISKLRLRGQIPGLWVVLSQKACKHLLSSAEQWSSAAASSSTTETSAATNNSMLPPGSAESKDLGDAESHPSIATLASYDCRIGIDHVSLELRDVKGQRLVTAVASGMYATLVKTKLFCLETEFSLKSWTVTDGSRGSTAPFRRLAYAGTGSDLRGVSPPRSSSSSRRSRSRSRSEITGNETNFVTINHKLYFPGREQTINIHFLSLNLIFVRETVLKITSFLEGMRKPATFAVGQIIAVDTRGLEDPKNSVGPFEPETSNAEAPTSFSSISAGATFDGFRIQFVSGEGAICSIEMRDFAMRSKRDTNGDIKAAGDVRYFAVDDLTASLREHQSLIRYERPNDAIQRMLAAAEREGNQLSEEEEAGANANLHDGWELEIPKIASSNLVFRTRLQGLHIRYLARFSSVMSHYFSALYEELRKSRFAAELEAASLTEQNEGPARVVTEKKSRSMLFEIDARNVSVILPRHSGNSDEALIFSLPIIHVGNSDLPAAGYKSRVRVSFSELQASVQYRVPGSGRSSFLYDTPFSSKTAAELELDIGDFAEFRKSQANGGSPLAVATSFIRARFSIADSYSMHLCEAQYSVLYFVLTENLVESIDGEAMALENDESTANVEQHFEARIQPDATETFQPVLSSDGIDFQNIAPILSTDDTASQRKSPFARLLLQVPVCSIVLSRGWDVSDPDCRIVESKLRDTSGNFTYGDSELVVELSSSIQAISDLRIERANGARTFAYPIQEDKRTDESSTLERTENFSFAYSKSFGHRPSIAVTLSHIELKVIPELFQDMSHLAIPGWPFLQTSSFAPACEYLGRTMSVCFTDSQVLLCADEFAGDSRGLILTGQFLARLDWMRKTGAKSISLQTASLQIALEQRLESAKLYPSSDGITAKRYTNRDSVIIYPSDSLIDYFGPGVDEKGARVVVEAESILCRINVKDTPALFAVLRRLGRLEKSYLSGRNWKQPGLMEQALAMGSGISADDSQRENAPTSFQNISLTYSAPAARVLLTDQSEGRFVPILELNLESVLMEGTVPYLLQVGVQMSVNLFSRKKGWWEPALEPWQVQASISRGVSGTKSFVIKSDDRLNLNVTPDTIQGTQEVASSLRSIKVKADQFRSTSNVPGRKGKSYHAVSDEGHNNEKTTVSGPSVAAFHVRNELGLQVEIFVPVSSQRSSILHARELQVHMPVERLLPSNRSDVRGNENNWRHETLKCHISIPGFTALELSAAEVGIHEVVFLPVERSDIEGEEELMSNTLNMPIFAVWEIAMEHGVPICTIRSPIRVLNETNTVMEISLCTAPSTLGTDKSFPSLLGAEDEGTVSKLHPGEHFCIPIAGIERPVRIRPYLGPFGSESNEHQQVAFGWSRPINSWEWLKSCKSLLSTSGKYQVVAQGKANRSRSQQRLSSGSKSTNAHTVRNAQLDHEVVRCDCLHTGPDFFVAVVPECFNRGFNSEDIQGCRVDVALEAPLTFSNKLPGRVSYRISEAQGGDRSWDWGASNITILGAGVINPLDFAFIHCTDDTQNLSDISVAFENTPVDYPGENLRRVSDVDDRTPINFGPFIALSSILSGQTKVLQTCEITPPSNQKFDIGATIHVSSLESRVPKFELFAPFWLRNRSDTHLEVCSRSSFYGKPTTSVRAKGYPKGELSGRFLCFDGPYVSLRKEQQEQQDMSTKTLRQDWWTSPSDLRDINKPIQISIPNRSLLLDVRQTRGYGERTLAVTIRNAAFVVNNSDRCIQWCQSSLLDAHGNCPFRHVHFLYPQEEAPIHWNGTSGEQSIHIRLAESNGSSDWIWSPSLPLLLGNAGEVSAKMYRPKSQEQYIARILSSKLNGGAAALMILSEDRQNPPYRIVNSCKNRSVAFSQVGSKERPWLVRPGRATRYSWDDPLASAHRRKLEVDVIEEPGSSASVAGSTSLRTARLSYPGASSAPFAGTSGFPASRSFSKSSSSRTASQPLQLNIDIVNNVPTEVEGSSNLGLSYCVTMEGATKVLTFLDSTDETSELVENTVPEPVQRLPPIEEDHSVPVVLWDDLHSGSALLSEQQSASSSSSKQGRGSLVPRTSDYPQIDILRSSESEAAGKSMDIDAAFYLASAGISVVNLEPVELLYAHASNLHMNFESYESLQCFAFHVTELQVDNQLENPPYPVTLWAAPHSLPYQLHVELKRVVTDSGILMLKSLRAAARPCNLMVDEDLIGRFLVFLNEVSAVSHGPKTEILQGEDGEHGKILVQIENKGNNGPSLRPKFARTSKNGDGFKSSQRIYVEELKLFSTKIVLSSSVARGSVTSRNMALSPALRPFIAFLMNVENCEFEFSPLELRHLFDSRTHFISLIREYYETQLANQKIKLLTSNSLVGNPAALFDSVALGARDLLSEPGRGRSGGEFLYGVGRGSKSLITHTVGGLVGSISSIPKAVSTGLESAVADETYRAERERIRGTQLSGGRRIASSNPAQGAVTGFLSFAHGISSGVAGLVKDPVQGAMQGGASGFLKGMRKGLVGGVVKPVAGAIDLIAEPAAVISKQMNEADAQRRRGGGVVAPKRPPRTFWGESRRLVDFDMKASTGEELYKAVQITSGVTHTARLVDWVELSDRKGRSDPDAVEWVWGVVRQRTRAMGKSRKGSKFPGNSSGQSPEDLISQLRPEKTRIALLTEENVLIVTLECKLLLTIPLWRDATFSLKSNGKDLMLVTRMGLEATREGGSSILAETQSLFAAPWDASSATKRRKPSPGEVVRDRISCGSIPAREDLSSAILKIIEAMRKRQPVYGGRSFLSRPPSAIELPVLRSPMEDRNATELSRTRRSDAADGSAGVFVLPMRSPAGSGSDVVDDKSLAQLLELGFDPDASRDALKKSNGDIVKAVDLLTG